MSPNTLLLFKTHRFCEVCIFLITERLLCFLNAEQELLLHEAEENMSSSETWSIKTPSSVAYYLRIHNNSLWRLTRLDNLISSEEKNGKQT